MDKLYFLIATEIRISQRRYNLVIKNVLCTYHITSNELYDILISTGFHRKFFVEHKFPNYHVSYYSMFIDNELSRRLYKFFEKEFITYPKTRRKTLIYGDVNREYKVVYQNKPQIKKIIKFTKDMENLRELISQMFNVHITVCAVGYYPTGNIGILPHRDKEMKIKTSIFGISLGATRELVIESMYTKTQYIYSLMNGSMYILHDPTNTYNLHSITRDTSVTTPRFSMTFRDY